MLQAIQIRVADPQSDTEASSAEDPKEAALGELPILDLEEAVPDSVPAVEMDEGVRCLQLPCRAIDLDTDGGKTRFEELAQKAHTLKLAALRTALSRRVAQWDRNENIEHDQSFLFRYCIPRNCVIFFRTT